jgi:iron(III) transport system ATP-binding protein
MLASERQAGALPSRTDGIDDPDEGYLRIRGLGKRYGTAGAEHHALHSLDLSIREGELVSLLGPSGCGKTTTLRCVAGLERPDGGEIWLAGRCLTDATARKIVPTEDRGVGMAFQSYALWPHMTVAANVGYPLKVRRICGRPEIKVRVAESLERVGLGGKGARYPRELSGGEQQRVALARAIIGNPGVLLLDEPLSNLDAKLRQETLVWLVELLRELKVTTLYVTHDQGEALAVSDRVAVMEGGRLAQFGTSQEIYERPASVFVASFVGASNMIEGRLTQLAGGVGMLQPLLGGPLCRVSVPDWLGPIPSQAQVTVAVRPEALTIVGAPADGESMAARVEAQVYLGSSYQYVLEVGDSRVRVTTDATTRLERGQVVGLLVRGDPSVVAAVAG